MESHAGVPELVEYIRRQISLHGPVTFKWFMQQALYHPEHGYYGAGRARIGRRGDFYTSVSVSKIFGELLAKQFEEIWLRMNCPVSFSIVEEGAHDGQFAHDVLEWIRQFSPDLYSRLKYWIIEPNPLLQQEQQARLSVWPRNKIRWSKGIDTFEDGSLCGVYFANELLDAFPVHMVTSEGGPWQENFVDAGRQGFRYTYGPPSNKQLRAHLEKLLPPPATGATTRPYRTEVNLMVLRWIEDLSKVLGQGYILLADYGYPRDQYYSPEHADGTLMTYHKHRKNSNPLEMVGECDITAHVDFTSLAERAEACGLHLAGYCDQHHFLVALGENDLLEIERSLQELTPDVLQYIRSFKTLIHPSTMGMAFKLIGFEKSVTAGGPPLTGFSRCGDSRVALGLAGNSAAAAGTVDNPYGNF